MFKHPVCHVKIRCVSADLHLRCGRIICFFFHTYRNCFCKNRTILNEFSVFIKGDTVTDLKKLCKWRLPRLSRQVVHAASDDHIVSCLHLFIQYICILFSLKNLEILKELFGGSDNISGDKIICFGRCAAGMFVIDLIHSAVLQVYYFIPRNAKPIVHLNIRVIQCVAV